MPDARFDRAGRRQWLLLGVAAALLIASVAFAFGAPSELGIGSTQLTEEPGPEDVELYVTLRNASGQSDERAFEISAEVVTAQLESDPDVSSVRLIDGRNGVSLAVSFGDASTAERQEAATRLAETIDPGALRASLDGEIPRLAEAREELEDELWRKELLVLPVALLVLVGAVGVRQAAAAVLCAAIAVAGSLALLRLLGTVADVSLLGFAPAAAVGLVLGVEMPLRALRPARAHEREPRSVLMAAGVGALPGFALLATPLDQAASLALGTAFAALLAAGATLLVVPAFASPAAERPAPVDPGRLSLSGRRAWIVCGLCLAALCALAAPGLVYGATASYAALGLGDGLEPVRSLEDSLFSELRVPTAIAALVVALVCAWLTRKPLGLLLGPLSLLPAAAAVGVCALLSEHEWVIGRSDTVGEYLDTGVVAVAVCALAAIGSARSAAIAIGSARGARLELTPMLAATAIGMLAVAGLFLTETETGEELGIALAAGLTADLVLLRLPMLALINRRIGSGSG